MNYLLAILFHRSSTLINLIYVLPLVINVQNKFDRNKIGNVGKEGFGKRSNTVGLGIAKIKEKNNQYK